MGESVCVDGYEGGEECGLFVDGFEEESVEFQPESHLDGCDVLRRNDIIINNIISSIQDVLSNIKHISLY